MTTPTHTGAAAVVGFWREAGPQRWFNQDADFDHSFDTRFRDLHFKAAQRELDAWADNAEGGLALLLLLDQFPRNVFRGSGHAFATDPLARHVADRALAAGFDQQVERDLRLFFYMPFEHSEALADQERSLALHRTLPGDNADTWAVKHLEVIRRFGRFPHRNAALGRISTPEEQAYLDAGSGF